LLLPVPSNGVLPKDAPRIQARSRLLESLFAAGDQGAKFSFVFG
jgi:hypothetical protein